MSPEISGKTSKTIKRKLKKKSEEAKIYKFAKIASLVTAAAVVAFLIPMAVIISGNLKKNNTGAAAGAAGNTESGVTAGTVEGSAGQTAGSTGQADGSDIQAGRRPARYLPEKRLLLLFYAGGDYETLYNKLKDAANSSYYYGYGIAADTTDGTTAGAAVTENAAAAGEYRGRSVFRSEIADGFLYGRLFRDEPS